MTTEELIGSKIAIVLERLERLKPYTTLSFKEFDGNLDIKH